MRRHKGRPVLGPTGRHPEGKIRDDDGGEMMMAVGAHQGCVILEFGVSVRWIGVPPTTAKMLASYLIEKADQAEAQLEGH